MVLPADLFAAIRRKAKAVANMVLAVATDVDYRLSIPLAYCRRILFSRAIFLRKILIGEMLVFNRWFCTSCTCFSAKEGLYQRLLFTRRTHIGDDGGHHENSS